jgi:hypothetical protein
MKHKLTIPSAALIAILLAGCETGPSVYYPPIDPASVTVKTGGYEGNHQDIKKVYIHSTSRMSNEEVAQELQRQAAAVGGDMVIYLTISRGFLGDTDGMGEAIKTTR